MFVRRFFLAEPLAAPPSDLRDNGEKASIHGNGYGAKVFEDGSEGKAEDEGTATRPAISTKYAMAAASNSQRPMVGARY